MLEDFKDVFSQSSTDYGKTTLIEHRIDTGEARPIRQAPRRIPHAIRKEVDKQVDSMLEQGIIRPSRSPWASPIVAVPKKDGGTRLCVDYRQLNAVTLKDAYPLPHIADTLEALSGAKYFSTMDLSSGYWQVGVHPDDQHKTAFTSHRGLFEFRVLPFGLCNAPATFERLMEFVLAGLIGTSCLVYLDDIVVFSRTFEEHISRLTEVLTRLRQAGLKLKPGKCFLFRREIVYLGHVVSKEGIATDPSKTAAMDKYPPPKNVQELKQFIGFASYYRRFIPKFAEIASPLHRLTQKSVEFGWTIECQKAFEELKQRFTKAPVLAFPRFDVPFRLYTDASDYGIGAVLSQKQDGAERVIAYASRQLTKTERQQPTTEKEALAMIWSIKQFRQYLFGHKFVLITDHQPLKWLKSLKDPPPKLARWVMTLQQYDFEVEYRAGKNHVNADTMSRVPQTGGDEETRQDDVQNEQTESRARAESSATVFMTTLTQPTVDLVKVQHNDPNIKQLINWKQANARKPRFNCKPANPELRCLLNQWDKLTLQNGILMRRWKPKNCSVSELQVVLPAECREEALLSLHNCPSSGHLGVARTAAKLQQRFYWPKWLDDVKDHIKQCESCARKKGPQKLQRASLASIPIGGPFEMIAMDICGPFPTSDRGKKYILVAADYFTKWPECWAIPDQEAKTVARCLEEFISRHGAPQVLLTDQGRNFESQVIAEVCDLLHINKKRTTAYHPQCDGQVERFNRTLANMLAMYVSKNQKDWDLWLEQVLFAYRTSVHESTGATPFFLLYGREARLPIDLCFAPPPGDETAASYNHYATQLQDRLATSFKLAQNKLQLSQKRQADEYDKKAWGSQFKAGDRVWLFNPSTPRTLSSKLVSHWTGPYTVKKCLNEVNYLIQREGGRTMQTVHHNRLKPCTSSKTNETPNTADTTEQPEQSEAQQSTTSQPAYEPLIGTVPNIDPELPRGRPARNRRPPNRYGIAVLDYDSLIP